MIIIHTIGNIKNEPRTLQFKSFFEFNKHATLIIEYQYKSNKKIKKIIYFVLFFLKISKQKQLIRIFDLECDLKNYNQSGDKHFVDDLRILPVLFQNPSIQGNSIYVDLNEYHPKQNTGLKFYVSYGKLYKYILNNYLCNVNQILTVSESHQEILWQKHKLQSSVILSLPNSSRQTFSDSNDPFTRFVYYGLANKSRNLDKICKTFSKLKENYTIDLYLSGDLKYISKLKRKFSKYSNIKIAKIETGEDIDVILINYDAAILLYSKPWNAFNALPNKFFKFISMSYMLIVLKESEMGNKVESYENGITINKFQIMTLKKIVENLNKSDVNNFRYKSFLVGKNFVFKNQYILLRKIFDL
jgi:hypothetical protein